MVRETRHLWVGNLPDNIREDRIREHFKRYGRVQSVKLLPRCTEEKTGEITMACTVAFMDIKSASKAHNAELKIDDRTLNTEYYEPAAIPSAASPQNTSSPYSTSPGATRFANGHGSSDEHGNFPERFYDRSTPRVASDTEFIRRTGYHDTSRGRNRDRSYRNGPYNPLMDRHARTLNSSWTYDSTRYNNTTGCNQTDTGYSATPSENTERRNSDQSTKKKTKSRSGSRSPSPSGSTSSRSPSRSRSRSSSSSSSSSTSRDTSSTGSPKSRRLASSTGTNHQPVVHSDDRRPLAICVKNLPLRSSDTSLKDGLFHEYKKHGKVTWVKVVGQNSERHAIVCFKKPEDVEKALEVSYDKSFFGCKIEVVPYQGYDVEDNDLRPYEAEIDEFHPKATRTLFIGNLEKDVTASDLRKHFDQFGEIIEIDIKKQGAVSSYAFCQYSDIVSVVKAIRKMDGEHLGNNRIKLGFGKSMPYNCVWIDGVNENVNEKYLRMQFEPFGVISKVHIDREKGQALIFYEQVLNAQAAVNKMRGFSLKNTKIQVDFASRECQESFFERLEKQGTVLDRSSFDERRDTNSRSFESSSVARFSRYDTPTRPRTSSYSSRSSAAASQVTSSMQSPGTPGSVTPRGSGSRSRVARFAEYYDQTADYPDRHFRSYDEYSQGSAASHEDAYEQEYAFVQDSPTHVDPIDSRSVQTAIDTVVPFAPPDIRNLQKERVHLLEQLEECPSSGDELMSPKKRLKLELLDAASDVIIEANRDHRKVMEVRRLSDVNLKHHSRRPSIDSGKHSTREAGHDRSGYLPHAVCKRRKTAGSDSGSRVHHYDHSGSESVGGSRPGTPLVDEKPENFQPSEPRRVPREREGPLTLPLPRFAAQVMNRGSVSVAGIKGQKDNTLSSPPSAVTSPRISNPKPPSPVHVPPPASPPPRPPSLSSNSSDSDITPPSPSLEERIKSLDEKYEKWSGSRALSAAGGDALAMLDANLEKFRLRHKLLDLDLKEVQPSEIVKSVMAKRSVFDEDLKRLENVGEKYEPKEFSLFPKAATTTTAQTSVPATPLAAPPPAPLKLAPVTQPPKTPTMLSPRSAGTGVPTAKGLQYPFPTHPPVLMSPVPSHPLTPTTPTTSTPLLAPTTTSTTITTTARGTSHGENRLKPCASVSGDARTSSKVNVNRSTVVSSLAPIKASEKTNANIPNAGDISATPSASSTSEKHNKSVREVKSSDKTSEKISYRRDSNSSSPRADIKTRRNSDTSARRIEDSDKFNESDTNNKERAKSEERKRERLEKVRLENERLEREKCEKERIEKERLEKEKQEKERIEKERLEKERLERESELEKQRLEKERLEKERIEREKQEKARLEKERLEKERAEKARQEKERAEKERLERERIERENLERERLEQERLEKERKEREKKEREERERKEKEERERREREEQQERERLEKLEKERKERERKEREERERKEREERERKEREDRERREREERERKEREERERREEEERLEKEKLERERLEREKLERERKREEERGRHKEDNHDKRKDDHKHRENHSETKHRENSLDKHIFDNKNAKDTTSKEEKSNRDSHEVFRRESHDARSSHEKSRHHAERDAERRKESVKENRDSNVHDKHKTVNDGKDVSNRALIIESRHMSIDLEKTRTFDSSVKQDPAVKRKERNNSLPTNIGAKRRLSSHESLDSTDESKKLKLGHDHKKLSERRDSKDSTRSEERSKSKHKNNVIKSHDKHNSLRDVDEKRKEREKEREERHKKHKLEKQKSKSKSREKESRESPGTPKSPDTGKDFMSRLDLKANEEIEKQRKDNKECKDNREKRKEIVSGCVQEDKETREKPYSEDKLKKEKQSAEKQQIADRTCKVRLEADIKSDERKKRDRVRKITNSSDSDSDEPKKHSIFDIVDDEPAYISMYDKVKARSCKNMAKQEEEKRQEKIKAKFSQLKQSRAKREEKKRSTSWDEDSESDKEGSELKTKRCSKMLIDSSDDESRERKSRKKKEMYSDSDSSTILRQIKQEHLETSEDEVKNKNIIFRALKSRIMSDTSEDEYNKRKLQVRVKAELLSDPENTSIQGFPEVEEKPQLTKVKDELERLIKKERRNSKHQESLTESNTQIFGDPTSLLPDSKSEKFNSRHSFPENTSDEEGVGIKKERSERREKKHKKKQKKQKHSISDESSKFESSDPLQIDNPEKYKHHEKKKDHSKKEKRRDKTREKSKKSKKNKSEQKSEAKREGKMENIFGSLSEDSENGVKEIEQEKNSSLFLTKVSDEALQQSAYNSESEKEQDSKAKEKEEREREREEHKKRKEKKRREKERRLQEAAAAAAAAIEQTSNDNSMDYADMGKQLEENMMKDESLDISEEMTKSEMDSSNLDNTEDPFRFIEAADVHETKKDREERKEGKEKKKKRKKSKDERSKHHHHHHHHDKNKIKSPEFKKELTPLQEIKVEVEETKPQSQSLPTILDEHSSPSNKPVTPEFLLSPVAKEAAPIVSPIPKTPTTSKEKKRDKFIPGFGAEIDERIHESAVKSISEFETAVKKEEIVSDGESKTDKLSQITEEKPRVVISQEETEDAVAALLGESFGDGQFEECYSDEINNTSDQTTSLVEENNVQDDEEMRQAVQSLSATDLDVKPDTPQSEHELQIDTDTEEQEEISLRFESRTPDVPDFAQMPKTPDVAANYFRNNTDEKSTAPPLLLKTTPTPIGSPPSLTPIKPQPTAEVRKSLEIEQKSLPVLQEQQQRSVISQSWSAEKQPEIVVSKSEPSGIRPAAEAPVISESSSQQPQVKPPSIRHYGASSVVKLGDSVGYPPLTAIIKPDHAKVSVADQPNKMQTMPLLQASKSPTTSQLHNLPARSPVQTNKPSTSIHDPGLLSVKPTSSLIHNRLPITPVMVSKPLQATTVILQQSKVAHPLEPPKLVPTSDQRLQERSRMVYQTSTIQPPPFSNFMPNQPRMMIQGNVRHLPPQGLLVPTRQLPPNNYQGYLSNVPHPAYSLSPIVKEPAPAPPTEKNQNENTQKIAPPVSSSSSLIGSQSSSVQPIIVSSSAAAQSHLPVQQPSDQNSKSNAPPLICSKVITSTPSPKPFLPVSISPKPSPVPVSSPSPKPITAATTANLVITTSNTAPVTTSTPAIEAHQPRVSESVKPVQRLATIENSDSEHLNVKTETSTPSPVIVSTPKETTVQEPKQTVKTDVKLEEPPAKLAIEKVTEELNMSLEKLPEIKEDKAKLEETTPDVNQEASEKYVQKEPEMEDIRTSTAVEKVEPVEPENVSVIKEIEKFDEEKADTESIVSDISKERSSADILAKDDPLDTKEDSDYWSAKEVNIDSVIKTLCSADELSDHSSENGKDEWFDDNKVNDSTKSESSEKDQTPAEAKMETSITDTSKSDESEIHDEGVEPEEEQKEALTLRSSVRNRGGRGRGRGKNRGNSIDRSGIQTRRGKLKEASAPPVTPIKRGRGGRSRNERKANKSESETTPTDVYEFRDESDEANKEQRPRLILTIKSPAVANANNSQTTAIVKEVTKDGAKEIGKEQPKEVVPHAAVIKPPENKEEFTSPTTTNTRKSRRLQEKDTSRNTVDDTIEDVVKNTIQTRAAATQRRSARQAGPKQPPSQPAPSPEVQRKSPRGRKPRRGSEATENSSSDDTPKEDIKTVASPPKEHEKPKEADKDVEAQPEPSKEKPHEGLKAAMLRRIKGEVATTSQHEPTNLIDPVTGELIPMRESEEGKYIPLPGTVSDDQKTNVVKIKRSQSPDKPAEQVKTQLSVIAQPQQATIIQPPKPQSLKAHVLSSQVAQAVVTQQPSTIQTKPSVVQQPALQPQSVMMARPAAQVNISKSATPVVVPKSVANVLTSKAVTPLLVGKSATPGVVTKPTTPMIVSKSVTPINQHLNINTSLGMGIVSSAHLSPRSNMPLTVSSKHVPKQLVKPPVLSPVALSHPKQILQVSKQSQQLTKGHMVNSMVTSQAQIVNTQMAHMKQHQPVMKQQVIMGKGPIGKPAHPLHQQQILTGAVASPPLGKSQSPLNNPSRIIQGPTAAGGKGVMDPPKVDVSMANAMLGQRSKLSPQGPQQRLVTQTGIPVPSYEASLGEAIAHFPPGPLRPPPDLNPAHYMHPSHVIQYQQYLRQQQLQHLARSGGVEKVGDGQEGEEAPVTSPPLELRRPGSVGLALAGRGVAVPHSLHSPHDRATDSPQVGQVYNVHSARMQHYHPNRYYDQTEPPVPPPAHRQQTSHSSLAALGSDRGLAHITPMGTPDRPLSSHSALSAHMGGLGTPDRPLSSHVERPISGHGLMGAGLGAAGNLMGAVARHIGADAPTSQRGLQAATPPHASQVPPQAESLFMLLKQYPCMWQGLLALKNDQAAVQMYFVSGNDDVAKCSLPKNTDGSTPPLRIFQRMRLEPPQVEGVARKMQMENEHCMLLALPCGHDHMDVLKQSTNLTSGFITYLQQKQAAGIVNVAAPGTTQPPAYVVHIFPSCDFVNENLRRIAPSLLERVADIAHLLIVITTV